MQFLKRLIILVIHLVCLSGSIYLRPADKKAKLIGGDDWNDIMRYVFEICTIIGVLSYIIVQQGGEIKNQGLLSFLKQQVRLICCIFF